jgi:hypothetical protein
VLVTSDYGMNTLSVWCVPGGASGADESGGAGPSARAGAGGASAGGSGQGCELVWRT